VKGFVLGVLVTVLCGIATVFAVSRLGLYPIGADNPPSVLEKNLASKAENVYADKHKPAGDNPTEITEANLQEGAKLYESRCSFCHGGAKAKKGPLENRFSPPPPQLVSKVPHDPDAWLFWITKHGVRMTGMPAWDTVLTDEQIWKVVAFIKHSGKLSPDVKSYWDSVAATPASATS
jgi:mono/diheme cytochrome c family protein